MSEEHEQEKGFKIKDRRHFESDGRSKSEVLESEPEEVSSKESSRSSENNLPAIDFSTFILSLSTSAMVHLGLAPGPDGQTHKDIQLAKQSIDILGLLQEKTKGNLTQEESKLINELLYDLRLKYVSASH